MRETWLAVGVLWTPGGLLYRPFWGDGPGVSLSLCCFVVYSARQFVVCLSVCHFVLVFFRPFSIAITSLGEERANLSFLYVCSICACLVLSVSSSSWCLGWDAACDCGTPWTFLLLFFFILRGDLFLECLLLFCFSVFQSF